MILTMYVNFLSNDIIGETIFLSQTIVIAIVIKLFSYNYFVMKDGIMYRFIIF